MLNLLQIRGFKKKPKVSSTFYLRLFGQIRGLFKFYSQNFVLETDYR